MFKIYLGADHRGFEFKEEIKNILSEKEISFDDLGNLEFDENDDFPIFAKRVAEKISTNPNDRGILICGSGIGMSIVANRFKGVRAGLCLNEEMVFSARNDDDINILVLPADFIDKENLSNLIDIFLETKFSEKEKYQRRINSID